MMSAAKQKRRPPQQVIAALEAKIAGIRARAERQKAKKDPAMRHIAAAVRSIDKALAGSKDVATRQALDEARATLGAVLSLDGAAPRAGRSGRKAARPPRESQVQPKAVLQYLTSHPGSRSADIAEAIGEDTKAVSRVLKTLRAEGRAKSKGQARGMRYFAGSGSA